MVAVDALVSKVLDLLKTTVQRETARRTRPIVFTEQGIVELIIRLSSILDGLVDAQRRQHYEEAVKIWLNKLTILIYEIDDVLDDWNYEILKSRYARRKVWFFSPLCCSRFPDHLWWRHRFSVKVYNFNERFDALSAEKYMYAFKSSMNNHKQVERRARAETCVINMSEVTGRGVEKYWLMELLLADFRELRKLHPIAIVGMGGIGKTMLAKLVYNDEIVAQHFDKRFWVSVSTNRIVGAVLKTLVGHPLNQIESKRVAEKIQQSIAGKRILLVLDDVKSENADEWKELEDCLIGGSSGSKILVTLRDENVAKLVGCIDKDIYRVALLSKVESWSLFSEIAFCGWSSEERQNLEPIGVAIVERCEGLPLAIKTIAGLLRFQKSQEEWESVLGSELWEEEESKPSLYVLLCLCLVGLPLSLKLCFLYCAIFPKGYRMSKDELISLWTAQGFIEPAERDGRDMEMFEHDYFDNLVMSCLFQDLEVEEKHNRLDKTYCKMHDIVHDFVKSQLKTECLYVDLTSTPDVQLSGEVHHLHLKLGEDIKFLHSQSISKLKSLRSLILTVVDKGQLSGAALHRLFNKFTCLRSLTLSRCRLESIPSNINKLIHLRWLKLSKNYALKELPETICDLYNLQTLSVNWCNGLIHFPKGVETLIKLRHLKNDYTYFLLPKGVGKLSGLRKLSRVTIDPKFKGAFSLQDLENLNNIGGSLTIFFMERERGTLVEDAKQAKLQKKKHITALSLNFPERAAEEWMQQEDEELVEALKPPLSSEFLRITCCAGTNYPSWINTLTSMKKLKLWYWSNCEHLPALTKLPCLEHVEFNSFGRVKKVAAEFLPMDDSVGPSSSSAPLFPKLKNLQFMNMIEWEEWSD